MIGRIVITDVAPVVSCGRWPAKAVVGESVPVTATVFREGHDLIGADVVLLRPDGAVADVRRMRLDLPARHRPLPGRRRRGHRGGVELPRPGLGRHARHLAARRRGEGGRRPGAWPSSPSTSRTAPCCSSGSSTESDPPFPPEQQPALLHAIATLRNETLTDVHDRLAPALGARPGRRAATNAPLRDLLTAGRDASTCGSTASARCTPPGTSSSRAPRARAWSRSAPAPSPMRRSGCRRSPTWASTSSTCRRSTPSARSTARAPTTR